jgi:hypothetical protein
MNQHDDRDAEDDSEENVSSLGEGLSGVGWGGTAAKASAGYQKSDCGNDSRSNDPNDVLKSEIVFKTRF